MTLKVVQGLVGKPEVGAGKAPAAAAGGDQQIQAALKAAQNVTQASEAVLVSVRQVTPRSISGGEPIRNVEKAEQTAKEVAKEVTEGKDSNAASHSGLDSTKAKPHIA